MILSNILARFIALSFLVQVFVRVSSIDALHLGASILNWSIPLIYRPSGSRSACIWGPWIVIPVPENPWIAINGIKGIRQDYPIWHKDPEMEYKQGNLHLSQLYWKFFRFRNRHCCQSHSAKFIRLKIVYQYLNSQISKKRRLTLKITNQVSSTKLSTNFRFHRFHRFQAKLGGSRSACPKRPLIVI